MTEFGQSFVDSAAQCWSCPLFDRMFQIISEASAVAYTKLTAICVALFLIIFSFYVFGAVWTNLTKGFRDGWFDKSLRPVFINSIFVLAFFGMGVMLPRFITTITFEPVTYVTQTYSTAMINQTPEFINEHVNYQPITLNENGFFSQKLKDTTIDIAKVTLTQFQSFMKLGVAMIDAGLSWSLFFGVGSVLKHILLTLAGVYLLWAFFRMFVEFLCYFVDVIIAITMFAFFFPLSLVTAAFREASDVPSWLSWIKNIGKGMGVEQIKNVISSIISLGAAVITYTVILVIIAYFFADPTTGVNNFQDLLNAIMNGTVFSSDLDTVSKYDLNIASVIVLVYVLTFIYGNIPKITQTILGMFEVSESDNKTSKALGNSLLKTTKGYIDKGKKIGNTVWNKIKGN